MKKKYKWFSITAKDCKFKPYKGSGGGGQRRNKVETAMKCIHEPSGAIGKCEDHATQKPNKRKAFERMANSKEFQVWLKLKIDAGLDKVDIQEGDFPVRKLRLNEV